MSATEPAPSPPRRSRWLQFSLRTLLLVILVGSLGLAWYSRELRRRERIEKAIALLAVAPSVYSDDYDPIRLVRAVNSLHALGKDDAIVALRRFAERYPSHGDDRSPQMSLDLVVPLAFERADPENEYPSFWITARSDWEGFLSVHDDIPFRRGPVTLMGREGDKDELIDWAAAQGRLRANPLRPSDDPIQAAEKAIEHWNAQRERERSPPGIISPIDEAQEIKSVQLTSRASALRCVGHLLKLEGDEDSYFELHRDEKWLHYVTGCRRLGIRWSEEKQEYVATKGAK